MIKCANRGCRRDREVGQKNIAPARARSGRKIRGRQRNGKGEPEGYRWAFPYHVGLMEIYGSSIGAIKSTASLPLPRGSLRRLFSRDSSRDRKERRAFVHRTFKLGFNLTRVYDDGEIEFAWRLRDGSELLGTWPFDMTNTTPVVSVVYCLIGLSRKVNYWEINVCICSWTSLWAVLSIFEEIEKYLKWSWDYCRIYHFFFLFSNYENSDS